MLSYLNITLCFLQKINEKPQIIAEYECGKAIPNNQVMGKIERAIGRILILLIHKSLSHKAGTHQQASVGLVFFVVFHTSDLFRLKRAAVCVSENSDWMLRQKADLILHDLNPSNPVCKYFLHNMGCLKWRKLSTKLIFRMVSKRCFVHISAYISYISLSQFLLLMTNILLIAADTDS